jgi:hypothetical protein
MVLSLPNTSYYICTATSNILNSCHAFAQGLTLPYPCVPLRVLHVEWYSRVFTCRQDGPIPSTRARRGSKEEQNEDRAGRVWHGDALEEKQGA